MSPTIKEFYIRLQWEEQLCSKQVTNVAFATSLLIRKGSADDTIARRQIKTTDGSRHLADTIFRLKTAQKRASVTSEACRSGYARLEHRSIVATQNIGRCVFTHFFTLRLLFIVFILYVFYSKYATNMACHNNLLMVIITQVLHTSQEYNYA